MNHDELFPVMVAQEMLRNRVDDLEIVRRIRAFYGFSHIETVAAVAAAHVLERHDIGLPHH